MRGGRQRLSGPGCSRPRRGLLPAGSGPGVAFLPLIDRRSVGSGAACDGPRGSEELGRGGTNRQALSGRESVPPWPWGLGPAWLGPAPLSASAPPAAGVGGLRSLELGCGVSWGQNFGAFGEGGAGEK